MIVFLYRVADVKGCAGMDMLEIRRHIESDTVDHATRGIIYKLKFDMLQIAPYKFARTEVFHTAGAECRFAVARTERIEKTENRHKFRRDVGELQECVDVDLRCHLFGQDICGYIFLEAACEFGYILLA